MVMARSNTLPYYSSPVSYQRGNGLGGLLRGLFRAVKPLFQKPIVKKGLKALRKAASSAVLEAGHEALAKRDIRAMAPALKSAGRRHAENVKNAATSAILEAAHEALSQRDLEAMGPALKAAGQRHTEKLIKSMTGGSKRKRNLSEPFSHSTIVSKKRRVSHPGSRAHYFTRTRDVFNS